MNNQKVYEIYNVNQNKKIDLVQNSFHSSNISNDDDNIQINNLINGFKVNEEISSAEQQKTQEEEIQKTSSTFCCKNFRKFYHVCDLVNFHSRLSTANENLYSSLLFQHSENFLTSNLCVNFDPEIFEKFWLIYQSLLSFINIWNSYFFTMTLPTLASNGNANACDFGMPDMPLMTGLPLALTGGVPIMPIDNVPATGAMDRDNTPNGAGSSIAAQELSPTNHSDANATDLRVNRNVNNVVDASPSSDNDMDDDESDEPNFDHSTVSNFSANSSSSDDDTDMFGPPRTTPLMSGRSRVPMISPRIRMREERKKILQLSAHKLERIKDSESNLRRSVCINNTYSRLTDELRREKQSRYMSADQSRFENKTNIFSIATFLLMKK